MYERDTVRVVLLNAKNQLLLMCVEGFDVCTPEGEHNKRFWCTIGGGMELQETLEDAALREIHEETGIVAKDVQLGPVVWFGYVDLIIKGKPVCLYERYIIARTQQETVGLYNPTQDEQEVVKRLAWFSFNEIRESTEVIFPVVLPEYLPDVLLGKYPVEPIEIDLSKKPCLV